MNPNIISRRQILGTAATLGALGAMNSLARAAAASPNKTALGKGAVIVFQGDSITDEGRKKELLEPNDNKGLGKGYAAVIAGQVLLANPGMEIKCYNRGISGNKVPDLAARWDQDAVALKPDSRIKFAFRARKHPELESDDCPNDPVQRPLPIDAPFFRLAASHGGAWRGLRSADRQCRL